MTLPVRREKRSVWPGVPLLAFLRHRVRRITTPAITQHRKAIGNVHTARQIARATIGDFFKAAPRARKESATNFCNAAKKALCLRLI